jgi:hypothetical protein
MFLHTQGVSVSTASDLSIASNEPYLNDPEMGITRKEIDMAMGRRAR